jgi:hypothetical protein
MVASPCRCAGLTASRSLILVNIPVHQYGSPILYTQNPVDLQCPPQPFDAASSQPMPATSISTAAPSIDLIPCSSPHRQHQTRNPHLSPSFSGRAAPLRNSALPAASAAVAPPCLRPPAAARCSPVTVPPRHGPAAAPPTA